ncbi:MAG: hypothetical protein ABID63_08880 [Pseudomonadota bacterium]
MCRSLAICRFIMLAGLVLMAIVPATGLAADYETIRDDAGELRLKIAELDAELRAHLRKAMARTGGREIECNGDLKSLADCVNAEEPGLLDVEISISRPDNTQNPLNDLAATEERYVLYVTRMNRTNDLLSKAGALLFMPEEDDITADMDRLRRMTVVYVGQQPQRDLRTQQAIMIGGIALALLVIFAMIFIATRALRR